MAENLSCFFPAKIPNGVFVGKNHAKLGGEATYLRKRTAFGFGFQKFQVPTTCALRETLRAYPKTSQHA
jgi:hypothetical protein